MKHLFINRIIFIFTLLIGYTMNQAENIDAPKVNTFIPYGMTDKLFTGGALYFNSMKRTKFYCKCGCKQEVTIFRGIPRKFLQGHGTRMPNNRKMHSKRMIGNKLFEGHKMSESTKQRISERQKGKGNSVWKGGRCIAGGGYVSIYKPDHPFADLNNRMKEERLIVESYLGRFLKPEEIVHHKDKNPSNNNIENLQIVSNLEHGRIHHLGNTYALGRKHSKESKLKISKAQKGKHHSEETKEKIRISNTGQKRSEETKKRMIESRTGLKDSEQTKRNKSKSAKIAWEKRKNLC